MTRVELKSLRTDKENLDGLISVLDELYPDSREGDECSYFDALNNRPFNGVHYSYPTPTGSIAEIHANLEGDTFVANVLLIIPESVYLILETGLKKAAPVVYSAIERVFASK